LKHWCGLDKLTKHWHVTYSRQIETLIWFPCINRNIDIIFDKLTKDTFGYKICLRAMQNVNKARLYILHYKLYKLMAIQPKFNCSNFHCIFYIRTSAFGLLQAIIATHVGIYFRKIKLIFPAKAYMIIAVDFTKLWPQMFRTSFRSSQVRWKIRKFILEFTSQFVNKVPDWSIGSKSKSNALFTNWYVNLIMNFWTSQRSSEHLWPKFREIDCNGIIPIDSIWVPE
jgi:hypothetical protein